MEALIAQVGRDHVMLDIETLSTSLDCCILSIGAQAFDPFGDGYQTDDKHSFYVEIDLQSCIDAGMKIDADTIRFWLDQDRAAQKSAFYGTIKIEHALFLFGRWFPKEHKVWGHGSTFDNAILIKAHERLRKPLPWHFRASRDTRTLFDMIPPGPDAKRVGVLHNALDDARSQVLWVQSSMKTMLELGELAKAALTSAVDHKESIRGDPMGNGIV